MAALLITICRHNTGPLIHTLYGPYNGGGGSRSTMYGHGDGMAHLAYGFGATELSRSPSPYGNRGNSHVAANNNEYGGAMPVSHGPYQAPDSQSAIIHAGNHLVSDATNGQAANNILSTRITTCTHLSMPAMATCMTSAAHTVRPLTITDLQIYAWKVLVLEGIMDYVVRFVSLACIHSVTIVNSGHINSLYD